MTSVLRMLATIARDERGAEIVEYALVMGMVSLVAIGAVRAVGTKVQGYWKALDDALGK